MTARPPVVDLARRAASLQPELGAAVERVLRSGWFLLGPETEAFEAEFAAFCGRRHAVAVASGTEALRLALRALGVGIGDEVVVPAFTAVPTAAAVCATGASPVFADVERDTAMLDPRHAAAMRADMSPGGRNAGSSRSMTAANAGSRAASRSSAATSVRPDARMNSRSGHRPMTLRRYRIVPSTPPSLVKFARRLSSVRIGLSSSTPTRAHVPQET